MKKIMLKRSILNIRMLFVIVVNFAILFSSIIFIFSGGIFYAASVMILILMLLPVSLQSG